MLARLILRRLLGFFPSLLAVAVLVFFLIRLAPGGPFDEERAFPPEVRQAIAKRYGLDQSLPKQLLSWTLHLAHGDLGESFQYQGQSITGILRKTAPVSLGIGILALFLATFAGIGTGTLSVLRLGSWMEFTLNFLSIAGISLPTYLVATLLILLFSSQLGLLPPALLESPSSFILPTLTLAIRPAATLARITRATLLEVITQDFIRTSRAKGQTEALVLFRHALRNVIAPILSVLGPLSANILTGSFLVETLFQIPGMGKYFVSGVINRDYPLISGVTLFYATTLLSANLCTDVLAAIADPRISAEHSS